MTSVDGSKPFNLTCTNAETYYEGWLYMTTTNALTKITADESITVAVCDKNSVDDEGTAKAAVTGEKKGFFPLGCGKGVYIASQALQTYTVGCRVVNSDSVDGMCAMTAGSTGDNLVGMYMGDGEVTSATDGDLIPVCLCFGPDSPDHA